MKIVGRALVLGDDLNTDVMYPSRFLTLVDRAEQARHILEGLGDEWPARVAQHAVFVAGWNLGCGSSREQAATGLAAAGVRVVIAKSFSRLFLRNCVNNGLPIVESEALASHLADGQVVSLDIAEGIATVGNETIRFRPLPKPLLSIVEGGGLLPRMKALARG